MQGLSSLLRACALGATVLALAACGGDDDPVTVDPPAPAPLIDPAGNEFTFLPPGVLAEGSGEGNSDATVFAPDIRFPIEAAPAYANSQVYGFGGSQGEGGDGQCDARNFQYPWVDNFCEIRSWTMPFCPSGRGHQGVDLRPTTCAPSVHWSVATEDGEITNVGSYSITLTSDSGTFYRYIHLDMSQLAVGLGERVTRGQRLGFVSDDFGGALTTVHLHFDMRQAVELPDGQIVLTYVPPYTSLIDSYERLLRGED